MFPPHTPQSLVNLLIFDIVFHRAKVLILMKLSLSVISITDNAFAIYKVITLSKVIQIFSYAIP